ncbi:MAG: hypothetical protein ACC661_09180 [Verrucomicrobiales bacterium]
MHLNHLGSIASQGVWFNSFGRFDDKLTTIATRGQDLVVARLIPNWDNLNEVPLKSRSWDAEAKVYRSDRSHADKDVLYSRQPGTGKIFVVFRSGKGVLHLRPGETVAEIKRTNELFEPAHDGWSELSIDNLLVRAKSPDFYGKCYVLRVKKEE